MWFKSYKHFYQITTTSWTDAQQSHVHQKSCYACQSLDECSHTYVCKIWSKYTMRYKGYEHFHYLVMGGQTESYIVNTCSAHLRVMQLCICSGSWLRQNITSRAKFRLNLPCFYLDWLMLTLRCSTRYERSASVNGNTVIFIVYIYPPRLLPQHWGLTHAGVKSQDEDSFELSVKQ